jgi:2-C-methyl-D-erythritol 4-phosphate cytidylyltransferase
MTTSQPAPPERQTAAVLVAAGSSTRLGLVAGVRKPLVQIEGQTVLEHAAAAFDACKDVIELIVVAQEEDHAAIWALAQDSPALAKLSAVVAGGATRTDSVRAGVRAASEGAALVAVHDAARPLVSPRVVAASIALAAREGAALVAVPSNDTTKRVDERGWAVETLERSTLWLAQTPQVFRRGELLELLDRAEAEGFTPTDDSALYERFVGPVPITPGDASNLKITRVADLELAAALLRAREEGASR